MRIATLLLSLAAIQGADDRAKKNAERIAFAKQDARSDEEKHVLALLTDRPRWAAAFKEVEEKLGGAFKDDTAVLVTFDYDGDEFAKMAGATTIRFNLRKLEAYQKKLDDLERQRRELAKQGKRMTFRLPPAKIERFLPHELTHVLQKQKGAEAPEWFEEGLAQWVGDDSNVLIGFALAERKVESIETPVSEANDVYARGHLFFKWLESKGAIRKTCSAALFGGVPWKKALEDATGLAWDRLLAAEREWSVKEVDRLRPAKK
jgi:hypothetical protein